MTNVGLGTDVDHVEDGDDGDDKDEDDAAGASENGGACVNEGVSVKGRNGCDADGDADGDGDGDGDTYGDDRDDKDAAREKRACACA